MRTTLTTDVTVVGAGVSGLTTAICLAEAGLTVRVLASCASSRSTSAVAGAMWGPYLADDPRIVGWGETTRATLEKMCLREPRSGVTVASGMVADRRSNEALEWETTLPDFSVCAETELPRGYLGGWRMRVPIIDMSLYLPYLEARLRHVGVQVDHASLRSLDDPIIGDSKIVVNCAGLGSRELVGDVELYPVLGQLVVVQNPGITWFFDGRGNDDQPTYFIPQGERMVLGGCAIRYQERAEVDPELALRIIERCAEIEPLLGEARVEAHLVGLRPCRPTVRLEVDRSGQRPVVHNYGHGGSGVTASWGCAKEVLEHVQSLLPELT
jgi:D-amino-acid oxidase